MGSYGAMFTTFDVQYSCGCAEVRDLYFLHISDLHFRLRKGFRYGTDLGILVILNFQLEQKVEFTPSRLNVFNPRKEKRYWYVSHLMFHGFIVWLYDFVLSGPPKAKAFLKGNMCFVASD